MTPQAKESAIRTVIQTIGGIIGGIFVYKKWATEDQVSSFLNGDLMGAVIGFLVSAAGGAWGQKANSEAGLVSAVGALAADPKSPVKGVIVDNTSAGQALTSPKVAPAGTSQATAIAQR